MFVAIITSDNDIRSELLDNVKAENFEEDINDKVDCALDVNRFITRVEYANGIKKWADLRPNIPVHVISFEEAPTNNGVEH